jgi:hypothetical protein
MSFFPDLNVWLALSVEGHVHSAESWKWLTLLPDGTDTLIFSRYTHLGLLRLLCHEAVMGSQTLTVGQAWNLYDRLAGTPPCGVPRGVSWSGRFPRIDGPVRFSPRAKISRRLLFIGLREGERGHSCDLR